MFWKRWFKPQASLLENGRKTEKVAVAGHVYTIKEVSCADVDGIQDLSDKDSTWRLIVLSIIGPDGKRVYTDTDIPALKQSLSLNSMRTLGDAILALNGFGVDKKKDATP